MFKRGSQSPDPVALALSLVGGWPVAGVRVGRWVAGWGFDLRRVY
jgi:hypothetical protein